MDEQKPLGPIDRTNFKLYAEYLPNLRQMNAYATLPSPSWKWTRAYKVLPNKLEVLHRIGPAGEDDLGVSMPLPYLLGEANCVEYDPGSIFELPVSQGAMHLSWRLDADRTSFIDTKSMETWSKRVLKAGAQVACAKCSHPLTKCIDEWKNLPSGGWADMMDLWHCHKPDVPHQSRKNAGSSKGYAAAKILKPSEDYALVDVGSFYFARGQLLDLEIAKENETAVKCNKCNIQVGIAALPDHVKLLKWAVAVKSPEMNEWDSLELQKVFAAQLLAIIEETAVRRFIVHSGNGQNSKDALLIWVFTPTLFYRTEKRLGPHFKQGTRAMKVFYKKVPNTPDLVSNARMKDEDIQLPSAALTELEDILHTSTTEVLPEPHRKHEDWTIGLLEC